MSVLARWTHPAPADGRPRCRQRGGLGQRERQLQVQVDPDAAATRRVSLDQVIETTGNALWVSPLPSSRHRRPAPAGSSTPRTSGWASSTSCRSRRRRTWPRSRSKARAARTALRLGDVANVVEDHQPLIGDAVVDDGPGLMLVIEKFPERQHPGGDARRRGGPGARCARPDRHRGRHAVFRPATFIETVVANVALALLIGLVLVACSSSALSSSSWRTRPDRARVDRCCRWPPRRVLHLAGRDDQRDHRGRAGARARGRHRRRDRRRRRTSWRRLRQPGGGRRRPRHGDHRSRPWSRSRSPIDLRHADPRCSRSSRCSSCDGLAGAFLPPLVVAYLVAILASILVALTVTPALARSCCPRRPRSRAPRARAGGCSAATRAPGAVVRRARGRPRRGWRRRARRRVGCSCCPAASCGRSLPAVQGAAIC